jgi:hypothetical protein
MGMAQASNVAMSLSMMLPANTFSANVVTMSAATLPAGLMCIEK